MISVKEKQREEIRDNVCGGSGTVILHHIWEQPDLEKARMFTHITVKPGSVFGRHMHHGETEIYYILKGELVTENDGCEYLLHPGDSSMTKDGETHFLRNETDEPAELIAVILGCGSVTNI